MTRFRSVFNLSIYAGLLSLVAGVQPGMAQGTVSTWGWNYYGQLSNGSVTDSSTPVAGTGLTGVKAIESGDSHGMALMNDGTVRTWGDWRFGQLGNGTDTFQTTNPGPVIGLIGTVSAIAAGAYHSLALMNDGTVFFWGQLGCQYCPLDTKYNTAVLVGGLTSVIAITAGDYESIALKSDGTVWAWGVNPFGLGNLTHSSATPVQVSGLTDVKAIAVGGYFSLALKNDGSVWAWGWNINGQLGNGTTTDSETPVPVSGLTGVVAIGSGEYHSLALRGDGLVWAWGGNLHGQLGNGTTTNSTTPVAVSGLSGVKFIAAGYEHNMAVKADNTVSAWGSNTYGELGNCTNTDSNRPGAVKGLTGVTAIAGGRNGSMALGNPPPPNACSNQPPVALCANPTVSAGLACKASASVNNGSYDPDGDAITLNQLPAGPYGLGTTSVTLTATDSFGAPSMCQATVTVVDTTPPSVSSAVAQTSLWPPNHDLVNVGLTVSASDNCKASPLIGVSVFSNESDTEETGEGNFSPDAKGLAPGALRLRSERKGDGPGRVYLIASKADDGSGNVGFSCSTVVVPHSQSKADQSAVNSAAAAARAFCMAHSGAPPAGYVQVGIGPVVGPKQ